jgi:S-adenosylmethionine:tRNA-ribosyltransferase-isomerase (queuine synthetase)
MMVLHRDTGVIEDHHMDFEAFTVPPETAEAINACKARGGRVVCVGSTTVRTLETVACRERGAVGNVGRDVCR